MTLLEMPDLIQGTDEWLDQRRGLITASVVGQLITPKTIKPASNDYSRALVANLAAERITGHTDDVWVTADMQRGTDEEPRARDAYAAHTGSTVTEVGFIVREEPTWKLGFSPDGLVDGDGFIEAKSRKQKKQVVTVVSESGVPLENMAQIQAGLLVTERDWCDFVSYSGGMHLWIKRVYPDPRWFDAIVEAIESAESAIERMVADYNAAVVGLPLTERIVEMELIF